MKKAFSVILFLMISAATFAQIKSNDVKATVSFKIKNLGLNTSGVIPAAQATIMFDPAKLAESKIDAVADANTIDTDNDMRNNHLKKEEFFDVAKYPKIIMKSVSFTKKGGDNYVGQFNLTIKDKTKAVTVPFTYTKSDNGGLFKGNFKINRKDFGVGGNSFTLSNDVTIDIQTLPAK
ncbi:hypothetical protein A0256_04065 [Mucilaginibacter sp. PAMC 26640]|nr:hypothetical protein A0256_04065 [Mucilaginibacter sp. PAMC 26640]